MPIAKRVLILAFEKHSHATLEEVHIQSVLELALANKSGCISLPGKTRARIDSCFLCFEPDADEKPDVREYCIHLSEGLTAINGTPYAVGIQKCSPLQEVSIGGEIYRLYSQAFVKDLDLALLCAGSRNEGEVISDGGMHKKLKKLMCDKKIPTHLRDLPIIREKDEAIYVPHCAVCDRVKAKEADADYIISVYVKLP
jgi:tRNA(Ile)-lysidine synthetase-like protein